MKHLSKTVVVAAVMLTIAGLARPQDKPAAQLPNVDQILDKFVTAIGGKSAVQKQNSRFSKGTFEMAAMGISADLEVYEKAPNKQLVVINIPGIGKVQQGYNGSTGWAEEPNT